MRLRTLGAAAALVAFAAPPALAGGGSSYSGGCGFDTLRTRPVVTRERNGGTYTGIAYFAVALSGSEPGVVEADVSCDIRVNGVTVDRVGPTHVVGAGVGAAPVTFTLQPWDNVQVCDVVEYDDGTPTSDVCGEAVAICYLDCMLYWETKPYVDPIEADACARLGGYAPGIPGVLDVRPDGDVHAGGQWLVDCPPYGPY